MGCGAVGGGVYAAEAPTPEPEMPSTAGDRSSERRGDPRPAPSSWVDDKPAAAPRRVPDGHGTSEARPRPSPTPSQADDDAKGASTEGGRWLFQASPDNWVPFKSEISRNIERTQQIGQKHLMYVFRGETYDVDLGKRLVINWNTGDQRRIQYKGAKDAEIPGAGVSTGPSAPAGHRKHADGIGSDRKHDGKSDGQPKESASYRRGEWQWQMGEDTWKSFDEDTRQLLLSARLMGKESIFFVVGSDTYEANLERCTQTNTRTGYERKIRWVRRQKLAMQFQWQMKNGSWTDYDDEENETLCTAKAAGDKVARWSARGFEYQLDFTLMVQENMSFRTNSTASRKVRIVSADGSSDHKAHPSVCKAPPTMPSMPTGMPGGPAPAHHEKMPGGPAPAHHEKRFSLHPDEPHHPGPEVSSARSSRHGSASGHADPAGHPPFAPRETHFEKAFSAFRAGEGPSPKSTPPRTTGRESSRHHSDGGSSSTGASAKPPPPASRRHQSDGGPSSAGASAKPPPPAAGRHHPGPAAGGKPKSGVKLPDGVDWPADNKARKAAEELFAELIKVPINERKKTFRKSCLQWHPDKNLEDEDTATDVFQFLQSLKEWYLGE